MIQQCKDWPFLSVPRGAINLGAKMAYLTMLQPENLAMRHLSGKFFDQLHYQMNSFFLIVRNEYRNLSAISTCVSCVTTGKIDFRFWQAALAGGPFGEKSGST